MELVPTDKIEGIVGVRRSLYIHYGRAVSEEGRFYILHPELCIGGRCPWGYDLTKCLFSMAMEMEIANVEEDAPLILYLEESNTILNGVRSEL